MGIVEKQAMALEKATEQLVSMAGHLVTLSETCLRLRTAIIKIRDTEILSEWEMRQIAQEALE